MTRSIRICCVGAIVALAGNASGETVTDTGTFTFVVGSSTTAPAGQLEWFEEHGDIGIAYEGGELELHYHFEEGLNGPMPPVDEEYEPDEVYIRVSDAAKKTDGPIPFLGPGTDYWKLPQSGLEAETLGVPFVGLATEELDPGTVTSLEISLTGMSGPGNFALWQDGFPSPTVLMRSDDGLGDTFSFPIGVHDHANYGFSAEGVYEVTWTATANIVPEPGSLTALASMGMAGVLVRRRRKP